MRVRVADQRDREEAVRLFRRKLPDIPDVPELVEEREVLVVKLATGEVSAAVAFNAFPDVGLADLTLLAAEATGKGAGGFLMKALKEELAARRVVHVFANASKPAMGFFVKNDFTTTLTFPASLRVGRAHEFTNSIPIECQLQPSKKKIGARFSDTSEVELLCPGGELREGGGDGPYDVAIWKDARIAKLKGDMLLVQHGSSGMPEKEWIPRWTPRVQFNSKLKRVVEPIGKSTAETLRMTKRSAPKTAEKPRNPEKNSRHELTPMPVVVPRTRDFLCTPSPIPFRTALMEVTPSPVEQANPRPEKASALEASPVKGKRERLIGSPLSKRHIVSPPAKRQRRLSAVEPCNVCSFATAQLDNPLMECAGCDVVVHRRCYGVVVERKRGKGPLAPWYCDACAAGREERTCALCPVVGGALKATRDGHWVHSTCVLWGNGPHLINAEQMDDVAEVEPWCRQAGLTCGSCRKSGCCVGYCKVEGCGASFHPMCARKCGGVAEWNAELNLETGVGY